MCRVCIKELKAKLIPNEIYATVEILVLLDQQQRKCPAMRTLENLTVGGSEFYEDPTYCGDWLREKRETTHRLLIDALVELKLLKATLETLQQRANPPKDLDMVERICKHCGKKSVRTTIGMCSHCGRYQ